MANKLVEPNNCKKTVLYYPSYDKNTVYGLRAMKDPILSNSCPSLKYMHNLHVDIRL